jgi:hypothetical protein
MRKIIPTGFSNITLPIYFKLWYKTDNPAVRVMPQDRFWANTCLLGFHICSGDAIGFGQGGASGARPDLRKQVQNCAAHGMAGIF